MSVFPGLEAALDAAAERRYAGRRPRPWARWVVAPAIALCAAALVIALLPSDERVPAAAGPALSVPPETLARSQALTTAPTALPSGQHDDRVRVEHDQLPVVAAQIAATVPYPPGAGESMDWAGLPDSPRNMGSVNFRGDVQSLVEYRAACTWAAFWLFAHQEANAAALTGATAVLQDIPHWPTLRGALGDPYERTVGWPLLARASAAGDVAPLRQYASGNCVQVPSPYTAAIR